MELCFGFQCEIHLVGWKSAEQLIMIGLLQLLKLQFQFVYFLHNVFAPFRVGFVAVVVLSYTLEEHELFSVHLSVYCRVEGCFLLCEIGCFHDMLCESCFKLFWVEAFALCMQAECGGEQ